MNKQEALSNNEYWCNNAEGTKFGYAVCMGDLNNDGYDDLVAYSSGKHQISVFYGFFSGELELDAVVDDVKGTIAVEDVNGDNYDDVIVGDWGDVHIYYGGPVKSDFGNSKYSILVDEGQTSTVVAAGGDYNDDGINDVIADDPAGGSTYVVFGFSDALGIPERSPKEIGQITFIQAYGNVGDVNKDGYDDVIYQRPKVGTAPREVVLALGPDPDVNDPDWQVTGNERGSSLGFGNACTSAGDINGDGYIDIAIGDPQWNPTPSNPDRVGNWGKVYVWYGGPSGPRPRNPTGFGINPTLADADFVLRGDNLANSFGFSIASGDFNGDQYSDLSIGDHRAFGSCHDPVSKERTYGETRTGLVTPYYSALVPSDQDEDGIGNDTDNCPDKYNPLQENADGDEYGDICDNCPEEENNDQDDSDEDGIGDGCDKCLMDKLNDYDGDGYCDSIGFEAPMAGDQDNCPDISNPNQLDTDGDGEGDACDNCVNDVNPDQKDGDVDEWGDECDNCPDLPNGDQLDDDDDGVGDICDNCLDLSNPVAYWSDIHGDYHSNEQRDQDLDGLGDECDNCPESFNLDQSDTDGDGVGDLCDNCIDIPNADQADADYDLIGDICDDCPNDRENDKDEDGICGDIDNCPDISNSDQADTNGDGQGDACSIDLRVRSFEITQAIQSPQNDIPLFMNKPTWVRVYLDLGEGPTKVDSVSGKLIGFPQQGGTEEIFPNPPVIVAHRDYDRGDVSHSLNFALPSNWLNEHGSNYNFKISINPDQTVPEMDYSNNVLNAGSHRLLDTYTLRLRIFPIRSHACVPTQEEMLQAISHIRKVYPLANIEFQFAPIMDFGDPLCNGNDLVFQLWLENMLTIDEEEDTHYLGLACPTNRVSYSCSGPGGVGGMTIFNNEEAWALIDNTGRDSIGATAAHEIGHNRGLNHVFDPAGPPIDGPYANYPTYGSGLEMSSIGEYGFYGDSVYDPNVYYDFMSYRRPTWVSPHHYKKLADIFAPGWRTTYGFKNATPDPLTQEKAISDEQTDYFLISGFIYAEDSIDFKTLRTITDREYADDPSVESPYTIELHDASGKILASKTAQVLETVDYNGLSLLVCKILVHASTRKIVVKFGDKVLYEIDQSTNAPEVTVLSPNGGENLSDPIEVSWTGSDSDGDDLIYDIFYSSDGGSTYRPVMLGTDKSTLSLESAYLPGGNSIVFKVVASDGMNTASDVSDGYASLPAKTPELTLLSPDNNSTYFTGQPIHFEGYGYDVEDGMIGPEELEWSSDIDGSLGQGIDLFLNTLSPGKHKIRLQARDKDGNPGMADVEIEVLSETDTDGDGIADPLDNCPQASNPGQADSDLDGIGDACDMDDRDNDGYVDYYDNCPDVANNQNDADRDGIGDACDECLTNPVSDPENIILNGDFEGCNLDNWNLSEFKHGGAFGEAVLIDGECAIRDIAVSDTSQFWHVQLIQTFNEDQRKRLETGIRYNLSFDAASMSDNRQCHVYFGQDGSPWQVQLVKDIRLKKEAQHFSYDFTLRDIYPAMRLALEIGESFSPVTFDNFRLVKAEVDTDHDGIIDQDDNCPGIYNPGQADADQDGEGDACDTSVGFEDREHDVPIRIYPNPTRESITVTGPSGARVNILNIFGSALCSGVIESNSTTLVLPKEIQPGIYFVEVKQKTGSSILKVIVH